MKFSHKKRERNFERGTEDLFQNKHTTNECDVIKGAAITFYRNISLLHNCNYARNAICNVAVFL